MGFLAPNFMNNIRGAKIIYQESKATQPSYLYFLQKDENYCEVIVTSESGAKRKVGTFNMSYIPLSGTLQQSPVIGNIEFSTDYDTKLFSGDAEIKLHDGYLELNSTDNHGIAINPNQVYIKSGSSNNFKYINLTDELDYIPVKSNVNGAGLVGTNYYGNNYVDNSFVQKKYVDDALDNIDLSNYYTKNETYSQTEINDFLSGKQNTIGYTPENSANKSDSYTLSSSTTYASTKALVDGLSTKLDKGTYTGSAQDLKDEIDNLENSKLDTPIALSHGVIGYWHNLYGNINNFIGSELYQDETGNVGVSKTNPTEKLDVNGNVKATQIKDSYGTLKAQRYIPITGNTTLSEIHNGAVLNVTNTCNIIIETGLDINFQCVVFAEGSIVVTFVNSGVTVYAPNGLLLKTDKMASLICKGLNKFNLTGELATS